MGLQMKSTETTSTQCQLRSRCTYLDDPHATEELLQKLATFVRPHHCLFAKDEEAFHCHCLEWRDDEKESKSWKTRPPQIEEKENQTDDDLDGRSGSDATDSQ